MSTFTYKSFQIFPDKFEFEYIYSDLSRTDVFTHSIEGLQLSSEQCQDPIVSHFAFYIGMSVIPYYYTLQFADRLIVEAATLDPESVLFFQSFFQKGLAELMYRNKISLDSFPQVESIGKQNLPKFKAQNILNKNKKYLVSHGGGKDSIVSGELLHAANIPYTWFVMAYDGSRTEHIIKSINRSPQKQVVHVNQTPHPYRFAQDFVQKNGGYLGHKPMNAYLAFLGTCMAYIHNLSGFIVSNEASANEGNIIIDGHEINHQYTKSLEFETDFRKFLQQSLNVGVEYFSLLRPLSEIEIAKRFVKYPQYLDTFISCNTGIETGEWCAACPKCAFVYLMVYAYTNQDIATNIFNGNDLLDSAELGDIFSELAGMSGHKPFECVGEIEEVRIFLTKIYKQGNRSAFIQRFWNQFGDKPHQDELTKLEKHYSALYNEHYIPTPVFSAVL